MSRVTVFIWPSTRFPCSAAIQGYGKEGERSLDRPHRWTCGNLLSTDRHVQRSPESADWRSLFVQGGWSVGSNATAIKTHEYNSGFFCRFLQAAQASRFWPTGRGIFHNKDKTFLVWVNEEDHLRIISMQKGGDLLAVFKRLIEVSFCRGVRRSVWFISDSLGQTIPYTKIIWNGSVESGSVGS